MHAIHRIYALIFKTFRRKRMKQLVRFAGFTASSRALDVGGYPWFWDEADLPCRLTILNLSVMPEAERFSDRFDLVAGDGTRLEYDDDAFDLAVSNSVIEHVGTWENQKRFAGEIRRVAKRLWVQTPAREFFIEPHLLAPLVHWLPKTVQRKVIRPLTPWGWLNRPSPEAVDAFLAEVRLLTFAEMQELFPDCEIVRERVLGFTKSYIAVRPGLSSGAG